jgi:uncharacterized membrane protein YkvA (DUF1232 family)
METPAAIPVDAPASTLPVVWTPRDERRFWKKLARVVARISFAEDIVAAFYCAFDRNTPTYVRATLLGAILYFLLPTDAVPDFLAVLGFTDDATVLAAALAAVGRHLSEEHRASARQRLERLIG